MHILLKDTGQLGQTEQASKHTVLHWHRTLETRASVQKLRDFHQPQTIKVMWDSQQRISKTVTAAWLCLPRFVCTDIQEV